MNFLNNIEEKTIIVCPSNIKNKVLNEINKLHKLINIKIYSLEELKKNIYFDYDINTILYLMDKYNYSYDIAKYYIDNLYYVEDKKYNNEKLDFLVNLKKELIDSNLLIYNRMFLNAYKSTKFIVFGYDYIDSFNKKMLSNFDYKTVYDEPITRENNVYKLNTLEEEILFVINKIVSLINNKIDINNIYLVNLDSNYNEEIIRMFNMFKIPIDINSSSSIVSSIIGNKVFNKLIETKSFEETVSYMDSFDINNNNQIIYNSILNIFNKYIGLDYSFDSILKCVKYDFENTILNNNKLKNSIKIGDIYNSYYSDDDYVFLLGFNQGSIPRVSKDEDYISDDLKELLGLDTTKKLNIEKIKATTNNINKIKNITITYKKHYLKEEFYPSNLLSEDCFIEVIDNSLSTENSLIYSKIKLAKMLDDLINYDEKDTDLSKYYCSIEDIRYLDYDNSYKKIDKNDLFEYLKNYLSLSYSSINDYFKCQFKFYISRILKLNKYEDSFDSFLGSLFHYVLSKIDEKDFDFEREFNYYLDNNEYIKNKEYTNKELFYINKLKKDLLIVCDFIKEFHNDSSFKDTLYEEERKVDKSIDNLKITFKGFIDKTMSFKFDNKTLVSIVDYKTGNTEIKLDYAKEGIGLQLFIYMYLISKTNLFDNPYFVGFYLQNILNEVEIDPKKTCLEQKINGLKLHGYSTDNRVYLEKFDPTYEKSKYIQSMSITKDNEFGRFAKVLDEDTMKNITSFIDKKIDEARDDIASANFSINPKYYNGDSNSIGCTYCKYKDLCFMKDEDYVHLDKNKSFDFLREGDIDD